MTATQAKPRTETKAPKPQRAAAVYQIEVSLRPEFTDAAGAEALSLLQDEGLNTAKTVRASRLYELCGPFNVGHIQQAARELLCDPVTEEFRVSTDPVLVLNGQTHWRVEVWLKSSVSDPVGDSVHEALVELGLPAPESVRSAAAYRITGKCGRNHIEKAAAKCLANPVIHRCVVSETHG